MSKTTIVFGLAILLLPWSTVEAQAVPTKAQATPSKWREQFHSSRIELLRKQIASGNRSTDLFWQEVARDGTPLVEPVKVGDNHELVTFLWRGTDETQNVLVVWDPFTAVRPQDYMMTRLDGTDVWYLTVRVPRGARFIYRLSVNNPLPNEFFGDLALNSSVQPDPLNPHRFIGGQMSVVELADAPPQPWSTRKPGTSEGKVEQFQIASRLLGDMRNIWIYTPADYRRDGSPSAILVLFDGSTNLRLLPVPTILDNLIAASRIPATVAVFVADEPQHRNDDLLHNDRFADFVATELMSWLRERYNVTRDARQAVVGGVSAGGTAAVLVGLLHSEVFGCVLSQSGDFFSSPEWLRDMANRRRASADLYDGPVLEELEERAIIEGNRLQRRFIDSPKLPLTFYMNAGAFEGEVWNGPAGTAGILESNRHMRDVLRAKGYDVHYEQFIGGHDYLSWRGLLAEGLIDLIGTARSLK